MIEFYQILTFEFWEEIIFVLEFYTQLNYYAVIRVK